jgi:hydrogenase nickel incorporation protein HypB
VTVTNSKPEPKSECTDRVAKPPTRTRMAYGSVVMLENVGNLVCPALFDLGEAAKVIILSITEGEDKLLKYPHMFRAAELMILGKMDLALHVDFDIRRCEALAREVSPRVQSIRLSAKSGDGLSDWYDRLRGMRARIAH